MTTTTTTAAAATTTTTTMIQILWNKRSQVVPVVICALEKVVTKKLEA
jgi:hypothetical protein